MLNNNDNSDCSFSAEIPAYIYGEIGAREKSGFENHLENCSNCTDALADSAFARFSVREWRNMEFAQLETPVINIPYERKNITSIVSDSWLARLRQYVSLSPAWTAGGAMAVLAIGIGLVFAAVNMFQPVEVAEVYNQNSAKTAVSPTTQDTVQKPENFSEQSPALPNKNVEPIQPEVARQNNQNKPNGGQKSNASKISNNAAPNKVVKRNLENASTNNRITAGTVNKTAPTKARQIPALVNFEDEEDKSLRLAELFDADETGK
ncbi:MAG: zf-HC2 domain-containing protein [Pyrinomonadaceae bacterium]